MGKNNNNNNKSATFQPAASQPHNSTVVAKPFPSNLLDNPPPKTQLSLTYQTLLKDYIWVVLNFLSAKECQQWIQYFEGSSATSYTKQRANRYMAARECYRLQQDDTHIANCIFQRLPTSLLKALPFPSETVLGCNPNIRLYKYCPQHKFGGGTRFQVPNKNQNKDIVFAPQVGHMLLHLHGDDCLPHQGDVVEGGIKYVLRTDLVYSIE